MSKVLFLDIDGVLNSERSVVAHYAKPFWPGNVGEDAKPLLTTRSGNLLDPVAVSLIHAIVAQTKCKIVISSSWRIGSAVSDFTFVPDVVGLTTTRHLGVRGHQIQHYIDEHDVDQYCILDDDSDMLKHQLPYFVKTSGMNGISIENYYQVLRILK